MSEQEREPVPSSSRLGNVTGALLLGGKSERMGRDKARLVKNGSSWSTRTATLLDGLFTETLLVGGEPDDAAPGRRVPDVAGPPCALRGLVTAFGAASSERVLVVATDLPLLNVDLLLALTAWPEATAVVPVDGHGPQPLCAIYRRTVCLEAARKSLDSNRLELSTWLDELETMRVPLSRLGFGDEESSMLTNVNTPEELANLEAS
jgi:molybdopterin-guanine dinucleotide biosynthesis protein A